MQSQKSEPWVAKEHALSTAPNPLVSVLADEVHRLQGRLEKAGLSERDALMDRIGDLERGILAVQPASPGKE